MKRITGSGIKSWELKEGLWERVKDFVPRRKRKGNKTCRRRPGAGRKPIPPRQVLEAIFYVLRTGIQWKALSKEYGAAGSIRQYFSERAEAGFFLRMWQEGLIAYDEWRGLGREWQSADGRMAKAPLAREAAGRNPADREKKGTERGMAVESHGLPVGVTPGGANTHDIKLLEETVQSMVRAHPEGANVCLDAGYTGAQKGVEGMGYKARVRPCGEEKQEKEKKPPFKARRRAVEVCRSWMNRFRKLLVRYEKKARNYRALVEFACAVIIWRNLIPVHSGLFPG
jgi:transposase